MRILVTGARGKLGAATLDTLLQAGHEVTAVDPRPPG
jgi:UDP-glucose 4-epimerase